MVDKQIEDYLAEVAMRLSPLPAKRRNEELREMRAHLENAVAARRERGFSVDDAARDALQQFGSPEAVGKGAVIAWQRGRRLDIRQFWYATASVLVLTFVFNGARGILARDLFRQYVHRGAVLIGVPHILSAGLVALSLCMVVLVGGLAGCLFPKRAVAGTAFALSLHYGYVLTRWVYSYGHIWHSNVAQNVTLLISFCLWLLFYLVVAVLSAWAGSRWREGRTRPVRSA